MALDLLVNIIPSATGNSVFGMEPVPHLMANFVLRGANTALSAIDDESLELLAIVGGFLHCLGWWLDEYVIQALERASIHTSEHEQPGFGAG